LLGDQLSNEEFQMKAYLIVKLTVHDEAMFTEYRKQVGTQPNCLEVSFSLLVARR
jgi:hypothetical protein